MHKPVLGRPWDHRTGIRSRTGPADVGGTAAGRGSPDYGLLAVDFQGVYQVYIAAAAERLTVMRFALSLLAAPFAATAALVTTKVVSPHSLTSWQHLPSFLFGLVAAFGMLAVLPYLRMIEASITHARTARALNNFRLLYALQMREEFAEAGWSPNLPVDPSFPDLFTPLSWPGITAIVLAVIDGGYIGVGLAGLVRTRPEPVFIGVAVAVIAAMLCVVFFLRADIYRRRRAPTNPLGFPTVEA